jgi:hypothetical protein
MFRSARALRPGVLVAIAAAAACVAPLGWWSATGVTRTVHAAGQGSGPAPRAGGSSSAAPGFPRASRYTVPRTPWGDPDFQGVYSNSNEYATPLERPSQFAGKRLDDLTPEEVAAVRGAALQQMVAALPGGRVRGPDDWWIQNLDLAKRAQPWSVIDPPDGRIPPLTPEGQKRSSGRVRSSFVGGPFDGPQDLNYLERCIARGVPGSMIPVMYSNNYEFVQTPGLVAITYEIIHDTRLIHLDGRPHLGQNIRQHLGDARGRWDGDTLVVETTNLRSETAYRNANAATLKVTERFTRVSADTIAWSATLDDPMTWTKPWTLAMPLTRDLQPLLPFDCHEHNYGMMNILKAARAADAAPR